MEALKTSETLIDEGLVKSKQDRIGNSVDGMFPEVSGSFDLGNEKCVENLPVPVLESSCIDPCTNVKRCDPVSQPMSLFMGTGSGVGSSSQGDVTMKGISLFVQLTGGVANKVDRVENVGNANDRVLHRNEVKDNVDVGQEEFEVNVGDFVWALIRKQRDSWWPGIVCDASSAPKEVANRPTSEDDVLVRCFGSGKYIWCLAYNVKPFVGYFEGIPSQSKARRFIDAYEKAVAEFGHRVKTEFTCSCFSKMKVEKLGNIGDLSVSEFEPATFVDNIKDLARDMSMPNKIDYVVKQNCLSAFYRSLGHCQIPMHQLKPANGTPTKIKTEEENGVFSEIRDRRKSKFLAYPGECETEESKVDLNQTNGPVKKPGKKRGRKRKEATVCTSEVLSQLQVAARDCLFPCADKNFDSVKSFISGFRKRAFKDISSEISIEMPNQQILQETIPKKARKKKDKSIVPPTLGNNLNHTSLILDFQNLLSLNGEARSNANKSTEEVTGQSPFFSFGDQPVTGAPPCKLKPIKRKKNVSLNGEAQSNANKSTQEVTGQSPFFSFGDQPVTGAPPSKLKPIKREKNVFLNGEAQSNAYKSTEEVTGRSPFFSFGDQPATGAPPCNLKPIKREKNVSLNGEAQSNANKSTEAVTGQSPFCSFGDQPATGALPCKLKPIKKKKNAESNTSMPTWNYNVNPLPNVNGNMDPFSFHNASAPPNLNGYVNPFPFYNVSALPNVNGHVNPFPFALPNVNGHVNSFPFHVIPDIPQRNDVEGLNQSHASHFTNQAGSTPSFFTGNHGEPQLALVPTGLIHEPKKRGRKRKNIYLQANPGSTIIPHLNENGPEADNVKRVKKSKEIGVACVDLSYNKVRQDIEEVTGTAFLLKFSPDHPLPSNQDLNSVFSKYGALVESETQVLNENLSGQVVFLESSSAGEAFWRLQNDQPFGPALVNYRIQHLAGAESVVNFKTPIKSPSCFKPMDQQAVTGSTPMPDLNGNSNEVKLVKISKTIEEIRLPPKDNLISSEVHQGNGEVRGTALLLKFSPDHPLPSSQDLNSVFCKYGELNDFETQVSGETLTGQVVFVNPSFAGYAVQCLEKDRPFWPALVSYQVQHLYSVPSAIQVKPPINTPLPLKPPQNGEPPDLAGIKRNLEMMNSMLEKAGNTLSPEMRGKLESEIKGLMNKVSIMDGSSSSCL